MHITGSGDRSYLRITRADLARLASLAAADLDDLWRRNAALRRSYGRRGPFAIALCQGAALHYVKGDTGIKDFDVWSFFAEHKRPFPFRRRKSVDFEDPKFGQTPDAPRDFTGRRVDLFGRSLHNVDRKDPVGTLRRYLVEGATESAQRLALKAVVLISPRHLLGTIVWPTVPDDAKPTRLRWRAEPAH